MYVKALLNNANKWSIVSVAAELLILQLYLLDVSKQRVQSNVWNTEAAIGQLVAEVLF
jgi:hypothetical protein